jgi:hypothetical protein
LLRFGNGAQRFDERLLCWRQVYDVKTSVSPLDRWSLTASRNQPRLHDSAVDVAKLIEAIPALKSDDLPPIVNRVHMLGKLKEPEAELPARKAPSDDYLRTRVRLLQAHRQAQNNDCLDYEISGHVKQGACNPR